MYKEGKVFLRKIIAKIRIALVVCSRLVAMMWTFVVNFSPGLTRLPPTPVRLSRQAPPVLSFLLILLARSLNFSLAS